MIRIERLASGVLVIHEEEATHYVDEIEKATMLTEAQKNAYNALQVVDVGVEIPGVGTRWSENTTWLYGPVARLSRAGMVLDEQIHAVPRLESLMKSKQHSCLTDAVDWYVNYMLWWEDIKLGDIRETRNTQR